MAHSEREPGRIPHRRVLEKRVIQQMNEHVVEKDPVAYHEALLLRYLWKEPAKAKKWADQGKVDD
jgi:hypothetical protein